MERDRFSSVVRRAAGIAAVSAVVLGFPRIASGQSVPEGVIPPTEQGTSSITAYENEERENTESRRISEQCIVPPGGDRGFRTLVTEIRTPDSYIVETTSTTQICTRSEPYLFLANPGEVPYRETSSVQIPGVSQPKEEPQRSSTRFAFSEQCLAGDKSKQSRKVAVSEEQVASSLTLVNVKAEVVGDSCTNPQQEPTIHLLEELRQISGTAFEKDRVVGLFRFAGSSQVQNIHQRIDGSYYLGGTYLLPTRLR